MLQSGEERARREKLRALEDKRMAFAGRESAARGALGRLLFAQTDDGGFIGLGEAETGVVLITGPGPGGEEDFSLAAYPEGLPARLEEVQVRGEGMGGVLGFGKKGYAGVKIVVETREGERREVPLLAGYSAFLEAPCGARCALFSQKRRRGDANFVWDFSPIGREDVARLAREWMAVLGR